MTEKKITWDELTAKLSGRSIDTLKKQNTVICPVCDTPRVKGNHQKCSKITQMKHMKKSGEI